MCKFPHYDSNSVKYCVSAKSNGWPDEMKLVITILVSH